MGGPVLSAVQDGPVPVPIQVPLPVPVLIAVPVPARIPVPLSIPLRMEPIPVPVTAVSPVPVSAASGGFLGADAERHRSRARAALSPLCRGHGRARYAQGSAVLWGGGRCLLQLFKDSFSLLETNGTWKTAWERVNQREEWVWRGNRRITPGLVWKDLKAHQKEPAKPVLVLFPISGFN